MTVYLMSRTACARAGFVVAGGLALLLSLSTSAAHGDAAGASERSVRLVPLALDRVREAPSDAFERKLRAKVFVVDSLGFVNGPESEVVIVGRGRFTVGGVRYDLVVVEFRAKDGSRCWGVSVLTARGSPTSFTCESERGAINDGRITPNVVLTTGLLGADVRRLDFGRTKPVAARSALYSVPANSGSKLRVWVIPFRSKTFPFDVVFRDKAGRAVGGLGTICFQRPGVCHTRMTAQPKRSLTLVTGSGTQREVEVRETPCGANQGCSGLIVYLRGMPPRRASVVRPGERLRILGMGSDEIANVSVARIPASCSARTPYPVVARVGRVNIGGPGKFIPLSPTGHWTADLPPGFYALSTDIRLPKRTGGSTLHNGLFAIRVSDTHRRGTAPIPSC